MELVTLLKLSVCVIYNLYKEVFDSLSSAAILFICGIYFMIKFFDSVPICSISVSWVSELLSLASSYYLNL